MKPAVQGRYYETIGGVTKEIGPPPKKTNPMLVLGPGPTDKRCKHCQHFYRKYWSNVYFKCELRGNTNGPGTDHRANWPTCSKFKIAASSNGKTSDFDSGNAGSIPAAVTNSTTNGNAS